MIDPRTTSTESMILAQLLTHPRRAMRHIGSIRPELFTSPYRRDIATIAVEMIREKGEASPSQVFEIASDRFKMKPEEHAAYWSQVVDVLEFSVMQGSDQVFRIDLEELIRRRRNLEIMSMMQRLAKQIEAGEIDAAGAAAKVAEVETTMLQSGRSLADLMEEMDASEESDLLLSGLNWFDQLFQGGPRRGHLVVLGGPPGVGKTALALQVTLSLLIKNPEARAVWAAGEMTPTQLARRSLACISGVAMGLLDRDPDQLNGPQADRIEQGRSYMTRIGDRLRFIQSPLTPSKIEQEIASSGASWFVVDYLQLCRADRAMSSRREEVDEVVREMTRLTKQHNASGFCLSDMAKGEMRGRSVLDAYKESSEIAYAADAAFVLEADGDHDDQDDRRIFLKCLKNRHGPIVSKPITFTASMQRFR